jgi:hypothetical protein
MELILLVKKKETDTKEKKSKNIKTDVGEGV